MRLNFLHFFLLLVCFLFLQSCSTRNSKLQIEVVEFIEENKKTDGFWDKNFSKKNWTKISWSEIFNLRQDNLSLFLQSWYKTCESPPVDFMFLCFESKNLQFASNEEIFSWLHKKFTPYKIENLDNSQSLLTAYYEPILKASRLKTEKFKVPIYRTPLGYKNNQTWFSRKEIDLNQQAKNSLKGREIAWLKDEIDALILHIQGSGRLIFTENNGEKKQIRVSFAGSNNHEYQSVANYLLRLRFIKDASWNGIRAWVSMNDKQAIQKMLWQNPRYIFFKEEKLLDANLGPKGASGVSLTPGRSIAVDRNFIPYGVPVWISSQSEVLKLNRLVMAQDTGNAIVGAVRADFFTGWGNLAGELAGKIKQNLEMFVLWPVGLPLPNNK